MNEMDEGEKFWNEVHQTMDDLDLAEEEAIQVVNDMIEEYNND